MSGNYVINRQALHGGNGFACLLLDTICALATMAAHQQKSIGILLGW